MKTIAAYSVPIAIAFALIPIVQSLNVVAKPNYSLRDLGTQYIVDWVGNSFPGTKVLTNGDRQHVQQEIEDIFVQPDGTVYSNAVWDERFAQASIYRDGKQIAIMDKMLGRGVKGGYAVTAKGKYVYVAIQVRSINRARSNRYGKPVYPEYEQTWYGVRRYVAETGKIAGFKGGYGDSGGFLLVNQNAGHLQGLAINQQYLYVSDTFNNQIKVYNLQNLTQQPILTWSVDRPGRIAFDKEGQLWAIQHQTNRILRFSPEGQLLPQQIILPEKAIAQAIAVNPQGDLLVADMGLEQNIKIYENITEQPTLKSTFGESGGIFAEPRGEFAPRKFYKPKGIGTDINGNIYVAQDAWSSIAGGGTIIQSYQPDGKLRWQVNALEFMSGLDIDPKSENRLYSKERLYSFNQNRKRGKTATYSAITLDPIKFPYDPRLHEHFTGVHLRYINDRPFLFMRDRNSKTMAVYRFDAQNHGNTAIPYGFFSSLAETWIPQKLGNEEREKIWIDRNLDGQFDSEEFTVNPNILEQERVRIADWFIEPEGNLWAATKTSIRQLPVTASTSNYPQWNFSETREYPIPEPFAEIRRLFYDRQLDTMYISGYTQDAPYTGEWKAIGKKLARYSNWSKQPTLEWVIDTPWYRDNGNSREKPIAIDVAGDYVFVGLGSTGKSDDINKQSTVFVYSRDRGNYIGSMQHQQQVAPIMLDKATGLNARKTKDGKYLVFLEDAAYGRSIIFHWTPKTK